jgi:hypothetical protein
MGGHGDSNFVVDLHAVAADEVLFIQEHVDVAPKLGPQRLGQPGAQRHVALEDGLELRRERRSPKPYPPVPTPLRNGEPGKRSDE